ncbi:hypothetical protein [Mesorhizobium loti]|uniref:hypothetical protein n=1 Tax=Rhizobium loti TaxID=381 RepID=UPI001929BAA2|nr:hypothetical protein [Mesorhizobium loti]
MISLAPSSLMLLPTVPPWVVLVCLRRARPEITETSSAAASMSIYVLPLSATVQVLPSRQGAERFAAEIFPAGDAWKGIFPHRCRMETPRVVDVARCQINKKMQSLTIP